MNTYKNPKITYKKEINTEYQKMRSSINDGKTLPYREYVYQRAKQISLQIVTKEKLQKFQTIIPQVLAVRSQQSTHDLNYKWLICL